MMTETNDTRHFDQKARQIRVQVSTVLTKWGLMPRFKRWRLTQDPETGMVVLFGILNNSYIATHTTIPFSNYFDPRLLNDLANELQVQVVSCSTDGLRYAFIRDRGTLGAVLPTHIDYPFVDNGKLLVRVVYGNPPQSVPAPPLGTAIVDDHTLTDEGVEAFLKVFDDIKLRDDAARLLSAQKLPDIVMIEKEEFDRRIAEHEDNQRRMKRIRKLIDTAD